MTGQFNISGDIIILVFQGRPDENEESLFLSHLTEVWQRIPVQARQVILSKHKRPQVLLYTRLRDYRPLRLGGKEGRVPVPIAEVGCPVELCGPGGSGDYLFSCDRSRLFKMPKTWALMAIGEEVVHKYLIFAEDPSHLNPPAADDPRFGSYDIARESKMLDVLSDECGFDRVEYAKMMDWLKQTECGLKPIPHC